MTAEDLTPYLEALRRVAKASLESGQRMFHWASGIPPAEVGEEKLKLGRTEAGRYLSSASSSPAGRYRAGSSHVDQSIALFRGRTISFEAVVDFVPFVSEPSAVADTGAFLVQERLPREGGLGRLVAIRCYGADGQLRFRKEGHFEEAVISADGDFVAASEPNVAQVLTLVDGTTGEVLWEVHTKCHRLRTIDVSARRVIGDHYHDLADGTLLIEETLRASMKSKRFPDVAEMVRALLELDTSPLTTQRGAQMLEWLNASHRGYVENGWGDYGFFDITRADVLERLGRYGEAAAALELAASKNSRHHVKRRVASLRSRSHS